MRLSILVAGLFVFGPACSATDDVDDSSAEVTDVSEPGADAVDTASGGDSGPDAPDVAADVDNEAGDGGDAAAARECNGSAKLCDRPLNMVVFPTTHNAMSSEADGWFGPNQQFGLARQLEDGVRGMLLDTHWNDGEVTLCHTLCQLGSLPFSEGLNILKTFLEAHPNEVIALILQDGTPTADTAAVFEAVGLVDAVYTHPAPDAPFPTLGELIDAGQRLFVTAESGSPPPGWYHHVWDLTSDTPYSFTSVDAFSCSCNRGCPADARPLFLLNHWLSTPIGLPDASQADVANSFDVLYGRATACWEARGRVPNFVAVDHYAVGDLFSVVEALNEAVDLDAPSAPSP